MNDKELVSLLNDPMTRKEGFSALVHQYSEQLYWKVRHVVLNHDDADDVLQNTFLKAWKSLDSFQGKSSLSTWLYRIAINEALDFVRKQKTNECVSADDDVSIANRLMADDYFDGDMMQAQLREAVAKLPDVQRTVFNLRYYDEMKYSEMSVMLNTSEGALKASYHLAVKKIIEYFKHID